ncbi:ribonuclease E/G [Halobacillus salinus]|uniref:ribonuclease E/G n=1 Tax=Halobacillus salinus TaxID=192814 RepID=UPI001591E293|nr:ribonuclease E/G [Halobacillus salinus]
MRTITLHTQSTEQIGIVEENGQVVEVVFDRPGESARIGSIYKGKVIKVHAGMQAAFVDIGYEKNAFLRKDAVPWAKDKIESSLTEGESLYVQVLKEPFDDKGAQVSADVTIPGLYTVYQPFGTSVSVSRKIDFEQGKQLKEMLSQVLEGTEGAIIRTAATEVEVSVIQEEMETLKKLWTALPVPKKPQCVWEDRLVPDQLLRKFPVHTIKQIGVDDVQVANKLRARFPGASSLIEWKKQGGSLPISQWQDALTSRRVALDGGGELIIDRTEAMTVFDVNSAEYQSNKTGKSHTYEVNKQAAVEIARQIRLRNLSGIIVVDFISMQDVSLEKKLVQHMKKQVASDPVKTSIYGITKLGLMEVTRRRDRNNVMDLLTEPESRIYTTDTKVYRLERDLLGLEASSSEAVLLAVHPDLYEAKKRLLSQAISSKIPQELFVRQDAAILDYQIELEGSEDMVREAIMNREYCVDNLF